MGKLNAILLIFSTLLFIVHNAQDIKEKKSHEITNTNQNIKNKATTKETKNQQINIHKNINHKTPNNPTVITQNLQKKENQNQIKNQNLLNSMAKETTYKTFLEISSMKKPKKTKGKSKGKKSNTKIKYLKNTHINTKKNYESYRKCKVKTGLIYLLRHSEKLPMELNLQPIFGRIDIDKFNFYLNDMAKSKFYQINLSKVLRISQTPILEIHNCFNIILNTIDSHKLLTGPLSLCFKSKKKVIEWMKTINEFKECAVDITSGKKENKMLIDFGKVNKLIPDPIIRPESRLMYDNVDKVVIKRSKYRTEYVVRKMMKKIVGSITTGSIQNNLLKRRMTDQLKKTKKAARNMKKKEDLIKKIVQKRIHLENKKKSQLKKLMAKNKEIQLLKAVKSRIVQLKKKETKKFNKEIKRQVKTEKRMQNKKTKNMINYLVHKTKSPAKAARQVKARIKKGLPPKKIKGVQIKGKKKLTKKMIKKMKPKAKKKLMKRAAQAAKQAAKANKIVIPGLRKSDEKGSVSTYAKTIMKTKKLKSYDRCIDNKILNFKDTKYIHATCKYIFGESLENKCDHKSKFCGMCCAHHAGLAYKNHYKKCFNKCSNLARGVKNDDDDDDKKKKKK